MICKKCCFAASATLLGDSVCELRTSNPANWRTIFPQESECKYPTERRAALMEQLSPEDREALELGCRVRAMPRDVNLDDMGREWFAVKRGYSIGRGKTPLAALRNAKIGEGWNKGESK